MELKEFIATCLSQINEDINHKSRLFLQGNVRFDLPVTLKDGRLHIQHEDSAQASNLPRISFEVIMRVDAVNQTPSVKA